MSALKLQTSASVVCVRMLKDHIYVSVEMAIVCLATKMSVLVSWAWEKLLMFMVVIDWTLCMPCITVPSIQQLHAYLFAY